MKWLHTCFACLLLFAAPVSLACDQPIKKPLSFVGLWDINALEILEGMNQIHECKKENFSSTCLESHMASTVKALPLFESPEAEKPFGSFLVFYEPGTGMKLVYFHFAYHNYHPLEPDLFDPDWGYGPHFAQTLLEQKGDWYKVSVPYYNVETKSGWLKLKSAHIEEHSKDSIVLVGDESYTIVKVGKDSVTVRDEQDADMWCDLGDPPPLKPFEPKTIPYSELYDENCRLKMTIKYTRGC